MLILGALLILRLLRKTKRVAAPLQPYVLLAEPPALVCLLLQLFLQLRILSLALCEGSYRLLGIPILGRPEFVAVVGQQLLAGWDVGDGDE